MSDPQANSPEVGRRRLEWTESNLPLLAALRDEFTAARPFDGLTIGVSLHIEPKTAALFRVLQAGGAEVVATGNLGTTQDDVARALEERGVTTYGRRDDSPEEHLANVDRVLEHRPHLLLDNGADLAALVCRDGRLDPEHVLGGTEETTSGGNRLRSELRDQVPFPVIVINDSPLKLIVENKHAVGQSVVESFMRITNLMIPGRRFVVFGYGWCGRGIAKYLRSLGGRVSVVDRDPIKSLEAAVDGFDVPEPEEALGWGSVFITATGHPGVIGADELALLPDGAILANAGHFDFEIDVPALRALVEQRHEPEPAVEELTLGDGRTLRLISGGRMFNLGGVAPKGNSAESMDLGFTLQALSLARLATDRSALVPGAQPVPRDIDEDAARRMLRRLAAGG